MKISFTWLLVAVHLAWLTACAQLPTQTAKNDIQVVLLAGQSNMAGAGNYNELDDATRVRIEQVAPRVLLSLAGKPPKPLSYAVSKFHEGKYGFAETFGPELFAGLTLAEKNPSQEYLFVKTAHGGTALYGAWNPDWSAEKAAAVENNEQKRTTQFYNLHIEHTRSNLTRLEHEGKQYRIVGALWMQGENDAAREISAKSYEENLIALIKAYRNDLDEPKMPFVIGQINSTYGKFREGPKMVRNAMAQVSDSVPHAALIRTSTDPSWADYPKHPDNVHYNTEGQERLGRAFALALLSEIDKAR